MNDETFMFWVSVLVYLVASLLILAAILKAVGLLLLFAWAVTG